MRRVDHKRAFAAACALFAAACAGGADLGPCDELALRESGTVTFHTGERVNVGEAILVQSCGAGSFCHSARATPADRHGAPYSINVDDLASVREHADRTWAAIVDGSMPGTLGRDVAALGAGDVRFGGSIAPMDSRVGREAVRNWLACGAVRD